MSAQYYITEQGNILKFDNKYSLFILKENGNKTIEWNFLIKPKFGYRGVHQGWEGDINNKLFNLKYVFLHEGAIDGYFFSRSDDQLFFRHVDVLKEELKEDNLETNLEDEQQLINLLANKAFLSKAGKHLKKDHEIIIPEHITLFSTTGKQPAPSKEKESGCTIS